MPIKVIKIFILEKKKKVKCITFALIKELPLNSDFFNSFTQCNVNLKTF